MSAQAARTAQSAPASETEAQASAAPRTVTRQASGAQMDAAAQQAEGQTASAVVSATVQPTPQPTAQPQTVDARTLSAITSTLEGAQSAAVRVLPGVMPSVTPQPGLSEGEGLPAGLTLSSLSPFTQDYALSACIYPSGGMPIPALIQHDYKTPVATMNGRDISVWTSGCGADAVSMVVSYLTGETRQTPYTLFRWAAEHGLYKGSGLEHEALTTLASLYGVSGQWIIPDKDAILQALNAGRPIIAHMGRGVFTANGHYIVLRGVAPDGTIYVNDPAVLENCYLTFPLDQIIAESKSDDPFMICSGPSSIR